MRILTNTLRSLPFFLFIFYACSLSANSTDSLQGRLNGLHGKLSKTERLELLFQLGKTQYSDQEYDLAISNLQKAIDLSLSLENIEIRKNALLTLGATFQAKEDFFPAIKTFNLLLQERHLFDSKTQANIYHKLSKVYRAQGNYELAYEHQLQALKLRKENGDMAGVARSNYQLGSIFFFQSNFDLALEYYQKTLDEALKLNDEQLLFMSYGAIGSTYNSIGNLELSISYNQLALELAEIQKNEVAVAYALHNIGEDFYALDSFNLALEYLSKSLDLKRKQNDRWGESASLRAIGNVYVDQGQTDKGFSFLEESLEMAENLNVRPRILEAYDAMAKAYERSGDGAQAVLYLKKYIGLKDSLMNEATLQKMGKANNRYEIESREKELVKKDFQIAKLHRKILFGGIILLLALLWLIYSRNKNEHFHIKQLKKKNLKIHQQNEELARANALQKSSNQLLRKNNKKIQLQNKKLENANQELQRFAYIASHDLKEPLRTIGSYASLINRRYQDKLDTEAKEFLSFITTGINRMYNLLGEVLNYSRLETSLEKSEFGWIDTGDLVEELQQILREQISENNARLIIHDLPVIQANRNHLLQIFQNLIINGLKYNDQEVPVIRIACREVNGFHLFSVQDNGIGISMEYKDKIFEVFQRLHGKEEYEGTGIGLAICKKLSTQYGGEIWVESEPGKGSCFYFSFPANVEARVLV